MHGRLPRLAVAVAAIVAVAVPADAGVPGGAVQELVFRAPVEEADLSARHNQVFRVESLPGLPIEACRPNANFDCTVTALDAVFTRKAGNVNWLPADTFAITVRTPPVADLVYTLTATQRFSDGHLTTWHDQIRVVTDLAQIAPLVTTGTFEPVYSTLALPDLAGTATLTRHTATTTLDVDVAGLEPLTTYRASLHSGTCSDPGPSEELWPSSDPDDPTAGLTTDADGHVVGSGVAPWVARPEARSVWIHRVEDSGGGGGGGGSGGQPPAHLLAAAAIGEPHHVAIACADLF